MKKSPPEPPIAYTPDATRARQVTPELEQEIAARLLWAFRDGCPVAPSTESAAAMVAALARRRWQSFLRRNKKKRISDTREHRIDDLARGLAEKCEKGGIKMVGPLISDYKWLAEQIAPILAREQ